MTPGRAAAARPLRRRRRLLAAGCSLVLALVALLAVAAGLRVRDQLRASLPQATGRRVVAALRQPVVIERDALGVPTISGADRLDVAVATGFVHAQDRFFQMDLLRRRAAGELAALLGHAAAGSDRALRLHRFRDVARRALAAAAPSQRRLLAAYAAGVNAGLAALDGPPAEYLLLRSRPSPWLPEDSLLVLLAMFNELEGAGARVESTLGVMRETLPPQLFDFLAPVGTELDSPLAGGAWRAAAIPGPEVVDLRAPGPAARAAALVGGGAGGTPSEGTAAGEGWTLPEAAAALAGSNAWAVSGARGQDGRALLANDLHLPLAVPNLWYRAVLRWAEASGAHQVVGATLPGAPPVVVGSNGAVAWGLTNAHVAACDLVVIETAPGDGDAYLVAGGRRRFEHHRERIAIKGGPPQLLDVRSTIWGPVIDRDHRGRQRALRWTAHDPEAVDLGIAGLESAPDLETAIDVAHHAGVPVQNLILADARGHIAWTLIGRLPRRVGLDGRVPRPWRDDTSGWRGWLAPAEVPAIREPASGCLWTANNRAVGGDLLARVGDGGYDLGARARQIRDSICGLREASARQMAALQLDDRALLLARWRAPLLAALDADSLRHSPARRQLRGYVAAWDGTAAAGSVGYRLLRTWRLVLAKEVFSALTAPCAKADPHFDYFTLRQFEGPLWQLVSRQPPHLLGPRYRSWRDQLLAAADLTMEQLQPPGGPPLADVTWGRLNTTSIRHPFSRALPWLHSWLDMPARPMSGDLEVPHVQLPSFGASLRMVVSPGHEAEGFFAMPGGESGNPASPHYRDADAGWAAGRPAPLMPGPPRQRLQLRPATGLNETRSLKR
jgi:penicillin G amidase